MEFVVLAKVVPDLEAPGQAPESGRARREGVPLFLNPFDQRALRVALDLRRSGERVSVLSMGPPSATPLLRETFALGVDAVELVSDPALAGSDTLVTARVLARRLTRAQGPVVLAGERSTDGETAQVLPEIATLLDLPFLGPARRVERPDGGDSIELTVDSETGWARYRWTGPIVVGVGEKAAKLVKPEEAALVAARSRTLDTVRLTELGLDPSEVGEAGSPTRVRAVRPDRPTRAGTVFADGPLEDRISRLLERIGGPAREPDRARSPDLRAARGSPASVVVLVSDAGGRLERAALPLLSAGRSGLGSTRVLAVGIGPSFEPEWLGELARAGADAVEWTDGPASPGRAAFAFAQGLDRPPPAEVGLVTSTEFGREVGARVAARRGLGLVGDTTDLHRPSEGPVVFEKPAFGGQAIAEIVGRTTPVLATVRPGAFPPLRGTDRAIPLRRSASTPPDRPGPSLLGRGEEPLDGFGPLDDANVVVAVGNGIGGPEGVEQVLSLLSGTGWALAATRRVVDAGWVPRRLQVGLTGRSLSPGLVVLAGVRGAPNHLVGWERARRIVAINPDPAAPVFARSDAGLVASWEEALPLLIAALRARAEDR